MSSSTEITLTPTYKITTRHGFDGVELLDLTSMLGTGGCALVSGSLERLAALPGSPWRRVVTDGERAFQMELHDGLPLGVGNVLITVNLRAGSAEVSRRWSYQTTEFIKEVRSIADAAHVPVGVAEAVRKSVNRALNGVLMQMIANELRIRIEQRTQVQQRNRVQQKVQVHQRATNQIQLVAQMRIGGVR
jgi:hypothetical protein